jgi:hypothetical protein
MVSDDVDVSGPARPDQPGRCCEWMERSLTLNPGHADTEREIENLRCLLAAQEEPHAGGSGGSEP